MGGGPGIGGRDSIIRHGRRDSGLPLRSLLWYPPVKPQSHKSVKGTENHLYSGSLSTVIG